ncbi:MAG: aldo/keto reductase [Solirubrobacterales bacterium]|nr:aldo/keto reductase [Solirubrobacterales bacterium]
MSTHTGTHAVPWLTMNDGNRIPQLGYGVFQVPSGETAEAVLHALRTGYRSIDTAAAYENEQGVGEAIAASGLARDEIFLTTKLGNEDHGRDRAHRALHESLERLRQDYVDLYLIHWPIPERDLYVGTWEALIELRDEGLVRSIGVSNFLPEHLQRIIDATHVMPVVNQVELHPHFQQPALRRLHQQHGILTEAYSPLGRGSVLEDRTIERIASARRQTPAQIVLRWHIQLGNVVIPKSATPERIEENFQLFEFELTDSDMEAIAQLETGERIGGDPATFS